jgi:hypothetical protein
MLPWSRAVTVKRRNLAEGSAKVTAPKLGENPSFHKTSNSIYYRATEQWCQADLGISNHILTREVPNQL